MYFHFNKPPPYFGLLLPEINLKEQLPFEEMNSNVYFHGRRNCTTGGNDAILCVPILTPKGPSKLKQQFYFKVSKNGKLVTLEKSVLARLRF